MQELYEIHARIYAETKNVTPGEYATHYRRNAEDTVNEVKASRLSSHNAVNYPVVPTLNTIRATCVRKRTSKQQ